MEKEKKGSFPERCRLFVRRNARQILFWEILVLFVLTGRLAGMNRSVLAAMAVIWGLVTQIFASAMAYIVLHLGAVPLLGPLVVKVITLPVFWLINGVAWVASLIGLNVGRKKEIFEAKIVAAIFMIGIMIGYILGKVF